MCARFSPSVGFKIKAELPIFVEVDDLPCAETCSGKGKQDNKYIF